MQGFLATGRDPQLALARAIERVHLTRVAAKHSFVAHTSEVEIRVEASSLRELFAEAGLALAEVMGGNLALAPGVDYEVASVSSTDRDALLINWLNELIFLAERERKIWTKFTIEELTDESLVAGVQGVPTEEMRTLVKAATFHGLKIEETPEGLAASVILDV